MSDYNNKKKEDSLSSWIFPVLMLMFFPPLGVLLLVLKLLDDSKKPRTSRSRHPYYTQQEGQAPTGARTTAGTTRPEKTVKPKTRKGRAAAKDPTAVLAGKSKRLITIGSGILAVCSFILLACIGDAAHWLLSGDPIWFFQDLLDLLPVFCIWGGGLGCLWDGLRRRRQVRRYRSYLAMIGRQNSISVSTLASATGLSPSKVRDDLGDMLDAGLFPQGFLDYGGDRLVLSGDGLIDPPRPQPAAPKAQPTQDPENAILAEIREVNDAIDNPKLSAQIDRIGVITAKILEYQKSRPEKAPQLHSFLSYYLPTTLKILRAYGQLEDQEVSGQNISAAMGRIEGMMDKVVEGFEKQLDLLFQGDAMDITTDVEVLERMLAKDGLSDQSGMTLGM